MTCSPLRISALVLLLILLATAAHAQEAPAADTTRTPSVEAVAGDSARPDSAVVRTGGGGADTVITYSARDSVIFDVRSKKARLYGDAVVTQGSQKLTAAYIEVDFATSELYAEARYDSAARRLVGVPVFKDAEREFSATSLSYNFRTKKGTLAAAETEFDEGFYYGEKIKRVDENTLFVRNGRYTTCDAPHPHYFFSAPEMRVEVGEKVFADQPTLHVADVPILPIPFGIFFPNRKGKQSGILIPDWGQTTERGFELRRLGFFWAGNDYMDNRTEADLFSKGGFTIRNYLRFRLRRVIEVSDLNVTYGQTRSNPDDPLTSNFILGYTHQQQIDRNTSLGGSLNFATANATRNTSTQLNSLDRLNEITTRNISSNFSFSRSFAWGASLSATYTRDQDIVTTEYTQRLPVSFSVPTWTPFASRPGEESFLDNLSLAGNTQYVIEDIKRDTIPGGGFRNIDTRHAITFSPSISFQPRLGYFRITPSISYRSALFFRRTVRELAGDTVIQRYIPGVYYAQTYSGRLAASTTLYGIVQPRIWGLNAIRHTLIPTISYEYQPDFGEKRFGYYDEVFNPRTNAIERYSVFAGDASVAPAPSAGLRQAVGIGLQNQFEAKIAQGDTLPDKKVTLMTLNLNTSYNAAAKEFRWSSLSIDASTDLGQLGRLTANVILDPYADSAGIRIPQLLLDRGEGLLRTESASLTFSAGFSDQGFGMTTAEPTTDSVASRRARFDFEERPFKEDEFFGESYSGAGGFSIPWNINFTGSYSLRRAFLEPSGFRSDFSLNTSFGISLTPTTRISSSATYDLVNGKFLIPSISFSKDLHCWSMDFNWVPSGFSRGFHFRLGLKAEQLQDIKLEQDGYFPED